MKKKKRRERLPYDRTKRCPAKQPKTGYQCGLEQGHRGNHSLLIETAAQWFGKPGS